MTSLIMIKWTIKKGINPMQMQEVDTEKKKSVHKSPSLYSKSSLKPFYNFTLKPMNCCIYLYHIGLPAFYTHWIFPQWLYQA